LINIILNAHVLSMIASTCLKIDPAYKWDFANTEKDE
jgi:hypothetical protein